MRRAMCMMIAGVVACSQGTPTDNRDGPLDPPDRGAPDRALTLTRFRPDTAAYAQYSGLADSQRVVVEDEAAWEDLWYRIHAGQTLAPPPVNFADEVVIVAALGGRPSGGYLIRIDSVYLRDSSLDVLVRSLRPGPTCLVATVITSPVDLVRVPRVAASAGFREVEVVRDCQ